MKRIFFFTCIFFTLFGFSQEVNQHVASYSIYEFLDEMAASNLIELNTAVKPYSRIVISKKLLEGASHKDTLTNRQKQELLFFLKDYNKEILPNKKFKKRFDLFYYKDSLFTLSLNPIVGYSYLTNKNGSVGHRWNGAEAFGYVGKQFGFYMSLRDNGVSDVLFSRSYLTQMQGANYKLFQGQDEGRKDFSEMRGGLSYGWKWGSVSLLKDHFVWGNNYNGANIFSGRQPSFPYLSLKLFPVKWIDFTYIHGWLVSQEIDSAKTYGNGASKRQVFYPKYLAANFFTITPFKKFKFSFGNSIVYSDVNVQPAYLIPFMFFKSVDHTLNGAGNNALGQNAQLFFDISSRNIKHVHLYSSLFIDEISISNMLKKSKQTNLFSFKAGFRITNLVIPNTSIIAEYTRTNPWVYRHPVATTTFESNKYNLGHYLVENSDEIYFCIRIKPIAKLMVDISYSNARKGTVDSYQQVHGTLNVEGTPFMKSVQWQNKSMGLKARYEVINDGFLFVEYVKNNISGNATYTAKFYWNNPTTINVGVNFGF